jgi:hypothetical protein
MSDRDGTNGKVPRRPRTASHSPPARPPERPAGEPSAPGPEILSVGAEDRSDGRTAAPGGSTARTDGSYGGMARKEHGHFGPGNKAAAGNGNARKMQEYRRQFLEAIHADTIPMLARKLQYDALKSGDEFAIRTLLDYCLGKPAQAVELTGADGEPLGVNFHQVTAIVLDALADDPARRIEVAAKLMELDDARDADA